MSSPEKQSPPLEVLLAQYGQAWQEIEHLDSSYIQITLIYTAIIGAYIGTYQNIKGNAIFLSIGLILVCACIIGALYRLRKLIDQLLTTISTIEEQTSMVKAPEIRMAGKIRTSTYLGAMIVILSIMAIFLTLTK